jgi:hypothetical protein
MNYPAEVRFWRRIEVDEKTGCWVWQGARDAAGYGRMVFKGRQWTAYRWSYVRSKEAVAPGLQLDHLCRNRACCNPDHLEQVTPRVNNLRGEGLAAINARKTHCPRGHPLVPPNLVVRTGKYARTRDCRTCHNRKRMEYYYAAKERNGRQ